MKPDALIVIDVQNALLNDHPYQEEALLNNINRLLDACRTHGVPVIYVQHEEDEGDLAHGTQGWEIGLKIAPKQDEKRVYKRFRSAFKQTDLHEHLQRIGAKNLVLCGMQTEYCVDTTCKVAFELGYQVTLPREGTSTFDNRLFKASDLIKFYEYFIWSGNLAKTVPMDVLIKDITG